MCLIAGASMLLVGRKVDSQGLERQLPTPATT
jgi:hypothetical protein